MGASIVKKWGRSKIRFNFTPTPFFQHELPHRFFDGVEKGVKNVLSTPFFNNYLAIVIPIADVSTKLNEGLTIT